MRVAHEFKDYILVLVRCGLNEENVEVMFERYVDEHFHGVLIQFLSPVSYGPKGWQRRVFHRVDVFPFRFPRFRAY